MQGCSTFQDKTLLQERWRSQEAWCTVWGATGTVHLSQTGTWAGSTECDRMQRLHTPAALHSTPVLHFGSMVGPCHHCCFLHKHRRAAVIIKINWLVNVLNITELSKSWVVCLCHPSGHCGQPFPTDLIPPSTSLFRIDSSPLQCLLDLVFKDPHGWCEGQRLAGICGKHKCLIPRQE